MKNTTAKSSTSHKTAYEQVAVRLAEVTGYPVRKGMGRCPSHDDHKPSLSVRQVDEGAALKCFAGCANDRIMAALGLPMSALFDRPAERRNSVVISATYDYCDENGVLLFQTVRYSPKRFLQRRPDGKGGWTWNLEGVRLVLYRLPEVIGAVKTGRVIFVAEGERDADALTREGKVATCNPMGAGKWRPEFTDVLRGAYAVVEVAHRDVVGYCHTRDVVKSLDGAVGIVIAAQAAGGNDAADHFAAGHSVGELVFVENEELDRLCAAATQSPEPPSPGDRAVLTRVSDIKADRVRWLWPGRVAFGKLTVFDGDPDLGKSTITLDLSARISTGSSLPDGATLDGCGAVIILSAEDGIGDTIRPRLAAAGADLSLVTVLESVENQGEGGESEQRPLVLPDDIGVLGDAIATTRAVLVVIDPLTAFLSERVDSHKDQHVRRALMPLARLAEHASVAIVIVRHLSKSGGANALYRGGGSIGIIGAGRTGLLVAPDPDDEGRRILAVAKNNLALKPPALAYRIVSDELHACGKIVWDGQTSHRANDLLDKPVRRGPAKSPAVEAASDFLVGVLAEGPQWVQVVQDQTKAAGVSWATVRRAKDRLGVRAVKVGGWTADEQGWKWVLPPKVLTDLKGAHSSHRKSAGQAEGGQGALQVEQDEHLCEDPAVT
jgi:hypothetical protein